jgi:hypothetical protein
MTRGWSWPGTDEFSTADLSLEELEAERLARRGKEEAENDATSVVR